MVCTSQKIIPLSILKIELYINLTAARDYRIVAWAIAQVTYLVYVSYLLRICLVYMCSVSTVINSSPKPQVSLVIAHIYHVVPPIAQETKQLFSLQFSGHL